MAGRGGEDDMGNVGKILLTRITISEVKLTPVLT